MNTKTKIQAGIGHEHFTSKVRIRSHELLADEPIHNGGSDAGPTPSELILSGLGACTASTLRMYADKKGWEVDRIDIEMGIRIEKTETGQTSYIDSFIEIQGNVSAEQKERMLQIAGKCPIHRLLTNPIMIATHLKHNS